MVMHPEDATAGSNEDAKARGGVDEEMHRLVGFAMSSSEQANHAMGIGLNESDEYE
jgi:hypothetical protein